MNQINKNIDTEETAKASKFQKIIQDNTKLLLGLAIGVLVMTAGIAMASKGFRTQPNESSKQQSINKPAQDTKTEAKQPEVNTQNEVNSNTTSSSSTQAPKVVTAAPASTQAPKVVTAAPASTQAPPPAPTCNISLKESYAYSAYTQVTYENSVHDNWQYSGGAGTMQSSYYAREAGVELARHEAKIAQILAEYQQKLASINCN